MLPTRRKCRCFTSMIIILSMVTVVYKAINNKTIKIRYVLTKNILSSHHVTPEQEHDGVPNVTYRQSQRGGIPKIIHQMWNNDVIPEVFQNNIRGLVAHNKPPEWKYYFWTIKTGTKLITEKFPELLQRYLKAENLLRADILRLAVIYHFGGVYFDLDTVSVKPLDPFVESHNCSFVTEPIEHRFTDNQPEPSLGIINAALFCEPNNWFIGEIIEKLSKQPPSCKEAGKCTGSLLISAHYKYIQGTSHSGNLPTIVDYRFFQDKIGPYKGLLINQGCVKEPFSNVKYEWAKEICRNFIKRGRLNRNISELAFTYHTWFHVVVQPKKLKQGIPRNITEIVKHVQVYRGN